MADSPWDDSESELDRGQGRFSDLPAEERRKSSPIIQIQLEPALAARLAEIGVALTDLLHIDLVIGPVIELLRVAAPEVVRLLEILRRFEALAIERAFGEAGSGLYEALTSRQVLRRLACFDIEFPAGVDLGHVARELSRLGFVRYATPLPGDAPPQVVFDPLTGNGNSLPTGDPTQWYLFRCNAPEAWNGVSGPQTAVNGNNTIIADIDYGFRIDHEEFTNLTRKYNSADGLNQVDLGNFISHGTAVLGFAGAPANGAGMLGFAPLAELWAIQGNKAAGTPLGGNKWVRAIDFVRTTSGAGKRKILILEVQGDERSNFEAVPAVRIALEDAIEENVIAVVAAGNGTIDAGKDHLGNPFPDSGSIVVGATTFHPSENRLARFSNFGSRIAVCAPGDTGNDLTCSSSAPNKYRKGFGGTSGAAPKVAGACALMLEANPTLTPGDVRTILKEVGTDVVCPPGIEAGTFLNVAGAVQRAL